MPRTPQIRSGAKRIVGAMRPFVATQDASELIVGIPFEGELLGVYRNPGPTLANLLITTTGIGIHNEESSLFLRYSQMRNPRIVAGEKDVSKMEASKQLADGIRVSIDEMRFVTIPVRGGCDHFRDVFEFARFLGRAIE